MSASDFKFTVIAGYRFFDIADPKSAQAKLRDRCKTLNILGTIILSHEGINSYVAGSHESIESFKNFLQVDLGFPEIEFKQHQSSAAPWRYLMVKVKKEIITMGDSDIRPVDFTGDRISPKQFKQWLDEKKDIAVLDTRNGYEVEFGKFSNAIDLRVRTFKEFAERVTELPENLKKKPLVMYCTGGIRCEKASALLLKKHGYEEVYQLDGGILNYFKEVGGDHYEGECLVFDRRVGLNPHEVESKHCYNCHTPLSADDLNDPHYVPFRNCPHCYQTVNKSLSV